MKKPNLLVLFLFISIGLFAQNFDRAKLDSLFARIDSNQKGMGSVSIFSEGKEVYKNSIGFADVAVGIKANSNTKYRIGSITKTFTAAIIMQLIDEKKLNLESRLSEFYPEIQNAEEITIEYLLRHRSGIYNFTNAPEYLSWMVKPKTREELVQIITDDGSVFSPNEKMEYSNSNFVLLSLIAEKIDEKDFAEILRDRITIPLKLANTYYGGKINSAQNEAYSYTKFGKMWELATETDMSIPMGAGAIASTPTDLNLFYNALFDGKVVTPESLMAMQYTVDNFGLGMFKIPFYEKQGLGHNGGIDGFQSNVGYFPADKFSVAYTTNGVVMPMNDILIGVLSIYFGREYELPEFKPALELKSEDLDQYLGVYSSASLPMKITITKQSNILVCQATGQPSFQLEAYEEHKFKFDQAMLKLIFFPEEHKMTLAQAGQEFEFKKE